MIPRVRTWSIRLVETGERIEVYGPTKLLARLAFRHDYPRFWGKEIRISLAKIQA